MTTTAPSEWSLLRTVSSSRSKQKSCPKLFYKFSASPEGGAVLLLTDLISLWSCSLSRSEIIDAAFEQHTSIDPSESDEQMKVFLDKLALSLHGAANNLAKENSGIPQSVVLKTSIDLPKPLKPLEWMFTLAPQPASELAHHILRPTLHQLSIAQTKLEKVFDILKDKDHVIERLLDRVAEKGVDMSLIFPTLTGTAKRGGSGVKVEDAKKLVPGMKSFERQGWEKGFTNDSSKDVGEVKLSELVEGCEKCFAHSEEQHTESMSTWVQKLPGAESFENEASKSFASKSQSQSQSQLKGDEDTESENEFETQATPPDLKKKRASPDQAQDDDSSSDEHGDRAAKRTKVGNGRIGALGTKSRSKTPVTLTKEKSSSPTPFQKRRQSATSTATETASESDQEHLPKASKPSPAKPSKLGALRKPSASKSPQPNPEKSASPASRPHEANSNASTPSRRLGGIGKGKQRTAAASSTPEARAKDQRTEEVMEENEAQQSQPTTPSRKIGRLGMRNKGKEVSQKKDRTPSSLPSTRERHKSNPNHKDKHTNSDPDATASESDISPSPKTSRTGPPSTTAMVEPKVVDEQTRPSSSSTGDDGSAQPEKEEDKEPETEAQKAARRRAELKRTIQTAGPKKKRRF